MIVRINGREEPKQNLQVRLGETMLRLGRGVRLGEVLLHLGGLESVETLVSTSPRCSDLRLGGALHLSIGVHA